MPLTRYGGCAVLRRDRDEAHDRVVVDKEPFRKADGVLFHKIQGLPELLMLIAKYTL